MTKSSISTLWMIALAVLLLLTPAATFAETGDDTTTEVASATEGATEVAAQDEDDEDEEEKEEEQTAFADEIVVTGSRAQPRSVVTPWCRSTWSRPKISTTKAIRTSAISSAPWFRPTT